MALYKAKPKNPYYFWAVMSIVLQATSGGVDEKLAVNMLLPLAQRMIEKMIKDGKMGLGGQEQETQLYLMVLELQQKYREALDVLDGDLGKALDATTAFLNYINTKRLEYLKKLGLWDQVNILTKKLLERDPDQWTFYQVNRYSGFFLDISKKTHSSRKKLKQILQKTQANNSKTQYFAN